ncbi:photosystem II protein PsbQ [Phormidium sp. LEGE 05292]|uniref:photosystem II protein PsbQ n=1 Tax=[Phormidium] sp. LEGE 05292 TaxID=767427 RepID=UPI0018801579|nr:photosystem II protein PsbQ [Phormidium sp. LEGE 05292]MBE9230046.1 photosystem II protein PsbQ [Phormidium sp. LEGE 05292]
MFKARYRSILAIILAFVATVLVSCGGAPTATKPPTYTPAQIERIQQYASDLEKVQERLPELAKLIQDENWTFVKNFIRGPLGELRTNLSFVERNLLPKDKTKVHETSQELIEGLILIDEAADSRDYKKAIRNFGVVQRELRSFLELTPQA